MIEAFTAQALGHVYHAADLVITTIVASSHVADASSIEQKLIDLLATDLGGIIKAIAQVIGIIVVIGVTGSQVYKAFTGGGGLARALPTIGGAFLLGAFLFNLAFTAQVLGFFLNLLDKIFGSVGTLIPGL